MQIKIVVAQRRGTHQTDALINALAGLDIYQQQAIINTSFKNPRM